MSLPGFNANGLLPDGVHVATIDELRTRCIDDFPGNATRPAIFAKFLQYRQALVDLGISATQWVDGSFVDRSRLDPGDVDVVNFIDTEVYRSIPMSIRGGLDKMFGENSVTESVYQVHSFAVTEYPDDHHMFGAFEVRRKYWRAWFSNPYDYSGPQKTSAAHRGRKGIVQITLGDAKLCPLISAAS